MKNKKIADARPIITASVFILAFAIVLFFAIASLGAAEGGSKKAPGAPDSLVSAGAPRSQLELKRMFEAMSLTYMDGDLAVYEPITREYRAALEERMASGESPALSVEEILFIVSDSASAYDGFDVIRFKSASGEIEREIYPKKVTQSRDGSLGLSALDRIKAVSELIELRVRLLSAPDAFSVGESGSVSYTPRRADGSDTVAGFQFGFSGDGEGIAAAVVFLPDNGGRVTLYPTAEELALCYTRVIQHTDIEATEAEKELLSLGGFEPSRCRNITPEYFYGLTHLRLFALGGEVVLTDVEKGRAIRLLDGGERLSSVALGSDGLFYTTLADGGSSVYKYSDKGRERLYTAEFQLAVAEPLTGGYGSVLVYEAERREDERFVTALECVGEPIAEYFAE